MILLDPNLILLVLRRWVESGLCSLWEPNSSEDNCAMMKYKSKSTSGKGFESLKTSIFSPYESFGSFKTIDLAWCERLKRTVEETSGWKSIAVNLLLEDNTWSSSASSSQNGDDDAMENYWERKY